MTRKPTDFERGLIGVLLQASGGASQLVGWIRSATAKPVRPRGRPRHSKYDEIDRILILRADQLLRTSQQSGSRPLNATKALTIAVDELWDRATGKRVETLGARREAIVSRLLSRLRPSESRWGDAFVISPGLYSHLSIAKRHGFNHGNIMITKGKITKKK